LFNAIVSVAIGQEGIYRAVLDEEEKKRRREEEKKRKRALLGPSEGNTGGAPPKYRLVYTPSAVKSRVPPAPP
jgi:hypothetical protein